MEVFRVICAPKSCTISIQNARAAPNPSGKSSTKTGVPFWTGSPPLAVCSDVHARNPTPTDIGAAEGGATMMKYESEDMTRLRTL
eukprot:602976-Prorocentrum_lima.AAC.1